MGFGPSNAHAMRIVASALPCALTHMAMAVLTERGRHAKTKTMEIPRKVGESRQRGRGASPGVTASALPPKSRDWTKVTADWCREWQQGPTGDRAAVSMAEGTSGGASISISLFHARCCDLRHRGQRDALQ